MHQQNLQERIRLSFPQREPLLRISSNVSRQSTSRREMIDWLAGLDSGDEVGDVDVGGL